ncbi:OmpA family protein [Demequina gelatinilytica]|uniref:OmpA family protein n=1 Tax=Demequina gelatinilytica TaxID=1638980 RepID=UPI000784E27E|nr:OmpA family protein [Demequina gelatinilytica]
MNKLAMTAAAVLVTALTGCSATTAETGPAVSGPTALAIVAESTANSARLSVDAWTALVRPRLAPGTEVVVVSDDGDPAVLGTASLTGLASNPTTLQEQLDHATALTVEVAAGAVATSPETDPLAAIALGARALSTRSRAQGCELLMSGSGLSTTGALPLQRLGLGIDPVDVVEQLASSDELPDLDGCAVIWSGLGAAGGDQEDPRQPHVRTLERLWTAILERSGATSVSFTYDAVMQKPPAGLPDVTPVPLAAPAVVTVMEAEDCIVEVPDAAIGFVLDEATFADARAATRAIDDAADALGRCTATPRTITVYGTTSSAGERAGRVRLSTRRATAVADALAEAMGVPSATITAVGLGSCEVHATTAVACVDDRDGDGRLVADRAQLNRRAVIVASPDTEGR